METFFTSQSHFTNETAGTEGIDYRNVFQAPNFETPSFNHLIEVFSVRMPRFVLAHGEIAVYVNYCQISRG
jgi:hypothetical protein